MPVFVIERRFAEQIDPSAEDIREINEINADEDVRWLMSFLRPINARPTACTRRSPPRRSCEPRPVPDSLPTSSPRSQTGYCPTGHGWPSSELSSSPCRIAYRAAAVRLADCVFLRMLRT
jgi:hypothetical protein